MNIFLRRTITVCSLLFVLFNATAQSIVLVNSYHSEYLWSKHCRQGFENLIAPEHQITYLEMDTKRIAQTEFAKQAENIWQEITEIQPDLVVTMDDNALKYLGQRISDAGIPLVFMGVNNNPREYFDHHQLPNNIAGVLERPLIKQNMTLLSKILPVETGHILLLMDNGMTSQAVVESTLKGQTKIIVSDFTLDILLLASYQEWQSEVNLIANNGYDALIISSYANLRDINNQQVPINISTKWTSENSPVPIFSLWTFSLGKGKAAGGLLLSCYNQGSKAAEIANEILETGTVPYYEVPKYGEYIFSQYELSRWGLQLPETIQRRAKFVD